MNHKLTINEDHLKQVLIRKKFRTQDDDKRAIEMQLATHYAKTVMPNKGKVKRLS